MRKLFLSLLLLLFLAVTSNPSMAQGTQPQSQDKKIYKEVDQLPVYAGGEQAMLQFLATNIRYPEDAQKAGIEGLVVVSFVVNSNGTLSQIKLLKSLLDSADTEALRVVRLMTGKWKPGKHNGKYVAVQYTLPIRFSIADEETEENQ